MKYTSLLASSAALAALAIVVPVATPLNWNLIPSAQAETNISFSLFYDGLGSHGDWVDYEDSYVFVPVNTRRGWRPYTDGHWVYARGYGWTWVSDEPFGWATYHYGRWGYGERIGWYWVPGTRWAPAWVSWRRSGDHVAWAPLRPGRGRGGGDVDIAVAVDFDSYPDYYWNVVPTESFLSVNIETVVIRDNDRRRRLVREAEFAGSVEIENNIVVNNAIEINYIEEKSGKKVKEVEVKKTDDPKNAKAGDGEVTAYTGEIEAEGDAKPSKITEVDKIKKSGDQAAETDAEGEQSGDVAAQPGAEGEQSGDVAAETDAQTGKKKKAGQSADVEADADADADANANAEAQTGKKKAGQAADVDAGADTDANANAEAQTGKKKAGQSADAEVEVGTDADANANAEVQTGKKKAGQSADVDAGADTDANVNAEAKTGKKKKAGQSADVDVDADANANANAQAGSKKKKVKETEALSVEGEAQGQAEQPAMEEEPQ